MDPHTRQLLSAELQSLCDERSKVYGDPLQSFTRLAAIWTQLIEAHTNRPMPKPITPALAANMMCALKILRASTGFNADSHYDCAVFNQFALQFSDQNL